MTNGFSDGLPFPYLRKYLARRVVEELPDPDCHLVGDGRGITGIVERLGWGEVYCDAGWQAPRRTWFDAANSVATYANKSFRVLFGAPWNVSGRSFADFCRTEAFMLADDCALLVDAPVRESFIVEWFKSRELAPVVDIYLESLEAYVRACHTLGNFMPCPDGSVNRSKAFDCSDRPELFWKSLAHVATAQSFRRQCWYEDNFDALALGPWFEGGTARLEGPYRSGIDGFPLVAGWLEEAGDSNLIARDLEARIRYMDIVCGIIAERSAILAALTSSGLL